MMILMMPIRGHATRSGGSQDDAREESREMDFKEVNEYRRPGWNSGIHGQSTVALADFNRRDWRKQKTSEPRRSERNKVIDRTEYEGEKKSKEKERNRETEKKEEREKKIKTGETENVWRAQKSS